jgi:hypothetical protein
MVLVNPSESSELSIIGVVSALRLVAVRTGAPLPDEVLLGIQNIALYASFAAPSKTGEPVTITTSLSSKDLSKFKFENQDVTIPFNSELPYANVTVRLENFALVVPTRNARYTILAKWKVGQVTVGQLELPLFVEVLDKPEDVEK